ncbi:hypothetical protein AOQ84DRAFT_381831 [Glonium stellatum]|uniref:Uncharacterized protein n=1 Tax=Glonium stellatum TaxID=574774 RepID=A0A8E2ER33_9PEZI|nr:hypothetical protein AOQ84DRAFT_381831 [Glonium stellatum]
MCSVLGLIVCLLLNFRPARAATWYFLRYNAPSGSQFLSFSGTMSIPTLKKAGTYYLWPGLQPTDNSGVYQNVLDGRSGTWWIGSGWCCSNPSLPWGSGFNVNAGDTVTFSNMKGSSNWTSTLKKNSTGEGVSNDFALASKSFNQAIFAIELDGVSWDFGSLTFSNVVITASGADTSWCTKAPENYKSATNYAISGVSVSVNNSVITCRINSVILQSPR